MTTVPGFWAARAAEAAADTTDRVSRRDGTLWRCYDCGTRTVGAASRCPEHPHAARLAWRTRHEVRAWIYVRAAAYQPLDLDRWLDEYTDAMYPGTSRDELAVMVGHWRRWGGRLPEHVDAAPVTSPLGLYGPRQRTTEETR